MENGVIPVITGFIAATEKGVTTTLGRGEAITPPRLSVPVWVPMRFGFGVMWMEY